MDRFGRITLAAGFAALAACSSGTTDGGVLTPPPPPPVLPGGTPVQAANVDVANDFFSPNAVLLATGGTVTWTWTGNNGHSVTSNDFSPNAPVSYPPKTLQVTFNTNGDYNYFCSVHGVAGYGTSGSMIGAVFVR